MIVTKGRGRSVLVRSRNEDGTRVEEQINGYWPYFFVKEEDSYLCHAVRKERGYKGVYGEDLVKIVVADPNDIFEFKQEHPHIQTWEANIPYPNRVLIDRINEGKKPFKNYDHRVWYLDCEWNPITNALTVMIVYDSYTNKEYIWFVDKEREETVLLNKLGDYDYETPAKAFPSEREMLDSFLSHMDLQDPDVITGWYVVGADIKTIIERCRVHNLSASRMSPTRGIRYSFKDWEQPIDGRLCIDLMVAFTKLWELKNGKLPSKKLDDVAWEALKQKKVELPDGHNTYYTDLPLYIHYCRQDVRLLPLLDSKVNAIKYYLALQHLVQCDIRSTPFITKMFTTLALTDPQFEARIPTKPQFGKVDYQGADVMEVEPGVHEKVGILDIKAMYHSNAALHNISWETLYEIDPLTKEITDKCDLYLGALSDVDDFKDCGNGTFFRQDRKGLLVRQMDNMTNLRNRFKTLMKDDPDNYDRWDTMQFACKSLVASMYGVAGDAKYGLYHPEIAAAITHTSRETLNTLKTLAENAGSKVLYGHTDSVFCEIGSPTTGQKLVAAINTQMAPIEVEFEKWCSSMILLAKNRYAGRVTWTDGSTHEPTLYVKGIELKQSRMPPVMKECMTTTIEGILANKEEEEITNTLQETISTILNGDYPLLELSMKGKLEKNLSEYKVLSGNSAAAAWANEFLGKGYSKGSYFRVLLDTNGKYIGFDEPEDIGHIDIGFKVMCKRFIVDKVSPYYEMVGWSMQPLHNTLEGLGNMSWL